MDEESVFDACLHGMFFLRREVRSCCIEAGNRNGLAVRKEAATDSLGTYLNLS